MSAGIKGTAWLSPMILENKKIIDTEVDTPDWAEENSCIFVAAEILFSWLAELVISLGIL